MNRNFSITAEAYSNNDLVLVMKAECVFRNYLLSYRYRVKKKWWYTHPHLFVCGSIHREWNSFQVSSYRDQVRWCDPESGEKYIVGPFLDR